ncbi:GntR family transcriptional regulator [Pseudomonas neuropathica]|jgi:GntR family transcriptional regulator|uniref:GntR family transcriptional regulator n=1 Tax=Pseudomonas zeae TaxID=2745510 RepID=A0A9E6NK15_9PSED|nr:MULTISPECIES: GntR family transcriptional regulator [Pseudomonas]MDX9677975.1 GntR family transcriptional regulator [Pseudomonas zeae]QXI09505.1 GntR family transcriptional regulator [Pseudomonas zeae]SEO19327.1 GntR family transcriptional regulator [Pseudomonas sp. ok266]
MNAPTLGYDERLPLYQRLREEMLAKIATGEWMPGAPIPTEAELTKHYGVAIGTVRKAVDTLVNEGLLLRSQGRGTYVRRPNFDASLARFFRQVNAAGGREIPTSRILAKSRQKPSQPVATALKLQGDEDVVHLERLRMVESRTLFHEDIWLPATRFGVLLEIESESFGELLYPFYETQCGQCIGSATETLTVEQADRATAKTLSIKEGAPVVTIERTALGYDRSPLEYRISRAAAEGFRYQIDIS